MKQPKRVIVMVLLLAITSSSSLWSGTTGKIAGTIIEKATGEPLPGANIVVVGTSLGAATDIDGRYTILYVPPGTYSVQVTFVGYKKVTVNDVRVYIDQTARIDVSLEAQAIEVGEAIVVAERKLVKPDVATSEVAISDKEIRDLPVTNVVNVIGMQAGINIVNNGTGIQIRGGDGRGTGADQSLFMVDGVTMRDPRNNSALTKVALSSIKEISIERGGFNAEYGQVQSGIVNVITNEGSSRGYSGSVTLKMTPPAPKYYRGNGIPDVQDPNSYWLRPYLDPAVCWTGTTTPESAGGWDSYTRSKYLPFVGWNAISQQLMTDNNPNNDLTPLGAQRAFLYETRKAQINDQPDYDIDAGVGGPVPFVSERLGNLRFFTSYRRERDMLLFPMSRPDYSDYDWRITLNSDISKSARLRISGIVGNVATMAENWNYGYYPQTPSDIAGGTGGSVLFNMFSDWTYSLTDIGHRSLSAKLTKTLSPRTYYEVSLDYLRRQYNTRPPAPRDTTIKALIVPGFYESSNPFGYDPNATSSDGIIIWAGEQQSLARDFTTVSVTTFKADITSQVNFSNLVKAGVELDYNDLNLDYGFIQMQTGAQSYASRVQMHDYPIKGAAYLQDKLETHEFTLNAGLRLDYSNSETDWWDIGPFEEDFISSKFNTLRSFNMKKSASQWQLSPRLGISHPITENSKLYFNYGHFKQIPQYEILMRYQRKPDGTLASIGDPNLALAKTISYELGFDYTFANTLLIQMTAFYRDITNQADTTTINPIAGGSYTITTDNSYSDIRGFELTLRKPAGRWLTGFLNYTYQVTTYGKFGEAQQYQDPSRQQDFNETTVNIYQARPVPSPYARANLIFTTPDDFGPNLLGHKILGGFMLNLVLNWSEGGWTTYNPQNVSGVYNNVQYVDYYDGTLRFAKTVSIKRFSIQLFMDITNLFNTLRLSNTGDQAYRQSLHLPTSNAYLNIPGNDKLGDYRNPGVKWQPEEYQAIIDPTKPAGSTHAIYYEGTTGKYWQYVDNQSIPVDQRWSQVDQSRIDQINNDKAYINMPGASTYWFLNPRAFTFGVRVSIDLE